MRQIVLFNPYSNNGRGRQGASALVELLKSDELELADLTKIADLPGYFEALPTDCPVTICGGDGTLNRVVNLLEGKCPKQPLYYYATGSGNDFLKDVQGKETAPVLLTPYLQKLPTVEIKGKRHFFLNGVGYGIDGYCCEEGDRQRAKSERKTNYTVIALKGLVYDYQPVNAEVTVDGVTRSFQRVWLAPTMLGRYYGGGMMIAPGQDRRNPDGELTLVVVHNTGKLRILTAFPTIMTGRHIRFTDLVEVMTGKDITVRFDRPNPLQIDGETVSDVWEYHARSGVRESVEV